MIYRFGPYSLDTGAYELRRGEEVIPIQPKVFSLLEFMLQNADRAIKKEELLDRVWPDAIVGDAALAQAVSQARRALGEPAGTEIIQTVRGRGYKLGVPVSIEEARSPAEPETLRISEPPAAEADTLADAEAETPAQLPAAEEVESVPAPRPRGRRWAVVSGGVAVVVALFAWLGSSRLDPPDRSLPIASGRAPLTSIAVLPFDDLSPNGDQEAFSDGLSEEIIHALTGVEGLRVVARTSAFAFKGRDADVRSIGAKLATGSLVEGSVRQAGDRLRITAQLVDTATGFHLWSESYERRVDEVFSIQEDIARSVVEAVRSELVDPAELGGAGRGPRNFDAYQLFLRGRAAANLRTEHSIREAISLFEEAIAVDPGYADAHAALAHALILQWDHVASEPRGGPLLARAEASAERAIEIDPKNAIGHASYANVRSVRYLDWSGAEEAYRRALELNPGLAEVRESYGALLMQTGDLDAAGEQILGALDLDPLSPVVNRNVGRYHLYVGDHHRAVDFLWRSLELNPDEPIARSLLWNTYTQMGRDDEAMEALVSFAPGVTQPLLRATARLIGTPATLSLLLAAGRLQSPCPLGPNEAAQACAYVGWTDAMFHCLDLALDTEASYFAVNPLFDPYRSDPRFAETLARAGLAAP